jgi:hypothetical protein
MQEKNATKIVIYSGRNGFLKQPSSGRGQLLAQRIIGQKTIFKINILRLQEVGF